MATSKFSNFLTFPSQLKLPHWLLLLGLCLLSRALTSVHYIADADSLRFALAAINYDVSALQPHFPGYPVFCFLVNGLYLLTGKFSYAFSLVGGLATFLILWSGHHLFSHFFGEKYSPIYLLVLFLNPMMWLLANRYMPDLLGAALAMICLALFIKAWKGEKKYLLWFFIIAGLLAGVRLSYMPLILLPAALLLLKPGRWLGIISGACTILLWLVPMVLDTGWSNLIEVATTHTEGHFTEWGGTVLSEPSHAQRLLRTLQFTWAHGLGGYWPGRHWGSAVFSVFLAFAALWFLVEKVPQSKPEQPGKKIENLPLWLVVFSSAIVYVLWIYFYQNVVHQSRHVLPLLPLLLLLPAAGCAALCRKILPAGLVFLLLMFGVNLWITTVLVWQHKKPTAVYQIKEQLLANAQPGQVFVSIDMINDYLRLQGVEGEFLSAEKDLQQAKKKVTEGKTVWVIGSFPGFQVSGPVSVSAFYHNPYVNSLWPEINLYRYGK